MSDLSDLGMIGALFSANVFVGYYATVNLNQRGHEIATGTIISGGRATVEYRNTLLWMTWLPQWAALVAVSIVFGVIFAAIAQGVGGGQARTVAYMCAGLAGFSAVFFFVFGLLYVRYCWSVLRSTGPDPG